MVTLYFNKDYSQSLATQKEPHGDMNTVNIANCASILGLMGVSFYITLSVTEVTEGYAIL